MGGPIKCSLIIPVLESYEAVRRQILYMNSLNLPDDFEVIIVDDGSRPPIMAQTIVELPKPNFKFKYGYRGDFRPFTKACAMNAGVKMAEGEWVWLYAIDFIISWEMIRFLRSTDTKSVVMPTIKYAVLDEEGNLNIVGKKKFFTHIGLSAVRKEKYDALGGFNETVVGFYPPHDDIEFGNRYFIKYGKNDFCFGPIAYAFPKDDDADCFPKSQNDTMVDLRGMRPDIFHYSQTYRDWKLEQVKQFNDKVQHNFSSI